MAPASVLNIVRMIASRILHNCNEEFWLRLFPDHFDVNNVRKGNARTIRRNFVVGYWTTVWVISLQFLQRQRQ